MLKKITIIGSAHPFRGGLAAYNERLAKEFIKENYTVHIKTFSLQYPRFLFPGKTQYADWKAPEDLNISADINSVSPFNWIKTGIRLKKSSPDLILIKYWLPFMAPCFGTIARIAKKNNHTRVISILDNIIPHEKKQGDKILSRYFVNSADGFIGQSRSVLNDLNLFDRNKPRSFCPHPLFDNFGESLPREKALRELGLDSGFKYLLFFGFIRDYKGLDLLLNAFADERLRRFKVKLIVAGEFYCDPKPYHEIISKKNLSDHVILKTDFIPDSQVAGYFCSSDLVVQPYKSATQSGITQIAYHFEKPMLVTRVGGLPEMVPHGKAGYVVNPEEKDIADALCDFLSTDKTNIFTENIRKEKINYSWKRMTDTIINLYQTIQHADQK